MLQSILYKQQCLRMIDRMHMLCQINQSVGVTPLIIIPRDDLMEMIIQVNASSGIDNGAPLIVNEVLGYYLKISVSQNTEQFRFRVGCGLFEDSIDLCAGASNLGADGEVDHGDIRCWNLFIYIIIIIKVSI